MKLARTSLPALSIVLFAVAGCSSGAHTGDTTAAQSVSIDIQPKDPVLASQASVRFEAVVTGTANTAVTWSILESEGGGIDSSGVYVAPAQDGTYHLLVRSVADPSITATSTIVVSAAASLLSSPDGNLLGMNLGYVSDYAPERFYADIVKTSRDFTTDSLSWTKLTSSQKDANGWPIVANFTLFLWGGIDNMHGTYAVSFTGRASSISGVTGLSYDAGRNVSTGTYVVTSSAANNTWISFTGACRDGSDPCKSPGVTDLKLMRPEDPGSSTSFPSTTLFNLTRHDGSATPLAAFLRRFRALRFMDVTHANGNGTTSWATRWSPSYYTQGDDVARTAGDESLGMSWEHVVLFANEVFADAAAADRAIWINVPHKADDAYIGKLAQLLKCGSDGREPWVEADGATCKLGPTYPPLNPNIKIYVEWSNEVWNTVFKQAGDNLAAAQAEINAGGSPLNFDNFYKSLPIGGNSGWEGAWRRIAKRGLETSLIFRGVFGDAAMMTRVRPVYMTQALRQEVFYEGARMLLGYYDNLGGAFVGTPHPPSYYFYGAGGAGYYNPDNASDTLTADNIWTSVTMDAATFGAQNARNNAWATTLGVKRVAYEGGPSFDRTGHSESAKAAAWSDPRMRQNLVDHHNVWSQYGGDLLVYYRAGGDYQWGFFRKPWESDAQHSPKMGGVVDLLAAARSAIRYGTRIPGTLSGRNFATVANGYEIGKTTGSWRFDAADLQRRWASYSFRADSALPNCVVVLSKRGSGSAQVYLDGVPLRSMGDGFRWVAGTVSPGLHGTIVQAVSGRFELAEIRME